MTNIYLAFLGIFKNAMRTNVIMHPAAAVINEDVYVPDAFSTLDRFWNMSADAPNPTIIQP